MLSTLRATFNPDPADRARRELSKALQREAEYFASVIRARLTQLGICHRFAKSQKDVAQSGVQEVRWLKMVGTPEGIYLMLDSRRLPRGVRVSDLADDGILGDLSVACRRPVRFKFSIEAGAWFIVERESGAWGVPRLLEFGDVLGRWPENSRKKLLVPMGIGENRKLIYKSLAEFPHALLGGATNTGKTTMLHSWICALSRFNSPDDVRLALIDLKGGVEFTRYKRLPHLLDEPRGFIKRPADVLPLLEFLVKEMERRLEKFEATEIVQNVDSWNHRHRGDRLPRLVLVVDELASLMLDPEIKKDSERLLADITARGRAPGVHVVLATQRPEVKVVSGLIKGNVDVRCAFRVPDNASSMVILDTTEAARFDDTTPQGRYIYRRGIEKHELQAAFITPGQMEELVRSVIEGRAGDTEAVQVAPETVFRAAVRQLGGDFSILGLHKLLRGRVGRNYINDLAQEYEGKLVEVDGELYELQPASGSKSRQLVPVGSDSQADARETGNGKQMATDDGDNGRDPVVIDGELVAIDDLPF